MAERAIKASDVRKLQQTVETFQTVLENISGSDGDESSNPFLLGPSSSSAVRPRVDHTDHEKGS